MSYWNDFPKAPTVAERKKEAEELIAELAKNGGCSPVVLQGRTISTSYWGTAWCKHIEGWRDEANRLERGRSYVRSGTVVDLRLEPGTIFAKVNGSSLYNVRIEVTALPIERWKAFKAACYGQVGSLLDLLQGRMPDAVLHKLTSPEDGLFPRTEEMKLACDCPDGAYMCKHAAAVLYGVGSRLDTQPELLFALRGVDHTELVAHAATAAVDLASRNQQEVALKDEDLADIFGIELASVPEPARSVSKPSVKKTDKEQALKKAKQGARTVKAASGKTVKKAPRSGVVGVVPKKKVVKKVLANVVPSKKAAPGKAVKRTPRSGVVGVVPKKKVVKAVPKGVASSKKAAPGKTAKKAPRSGVIGVVPKKKVAKKEPLTGAPKKKAAVRKTASPAAKRKAMLKDRK